MKEQEYCAVEIAFGDSDQAEDFVRQALDARLIASAQMVYSSSTWNWEDQRESAEEYLVFSKTRSDLTEELHNLASSIHDYQTFEFAIFPMQTIGEDYQDWLENELRD